KFGEVAASVGIGIRFGSSVRAAQPEGLRPDLERRGRYDESAEVLLHLRASGSRLPAIRIAEGGAGSAVVIAGRGDAGDCEGRNRWSGIPFQLENLGAGNA